MANRRITFTKEQQSEINKARTTNKDKNAERRLCVLEMKMKGESNDEIVARTDFNPTYARSLVTKYFAEGIESIIGKKRPGNNRNMTYEAEAAFVSGFIEKAKKGELTTVKDIKKAYEDIVGHEIGSGHIYTILGRHGWRKIKPRPAHPKKATPEVIETSKKLTIASII
jgi:transposase